LSAESPNFDLLRANGVLMVMAFHVLAYFGIRRAGSIDLEAMGFAGFLFFFVHTSFVLMLSLERQVARAGHKNTFWIFMARRCFRIYPLSVFVVLAIALFKLPLGGHPWAMQWPNPTRLGVLSNVLLVQNLTGSPNLQGPLWSLPVEMQMYLLLPALFGLLTRLQSLGSLLAAWGAATLFVFLRARAGHAYLTMYLPCFLAGVVAYALSKRTQRRWPAFGWPVVLWGAIICFTLLRRVEVGWLICLAIAIAAPQFVELRHPVPKRIAHFLAKYSYGFYLSHYFCIWFAFSKVRLPAPDQWALFFYLLIAIPVLQYHFIEVPFINLGKMLLDHEFPRMEPRPASNTTRSSEGLILPALALSSSQPMSLVASDSDSGTRAN
jgi:peptidoglycan/LPS O-acetylase OafA/YrhL